MKKPSRHDGSEKEEEKVNQRIPVHFTLNGRKVAVEVGAGDTALFLIRDRLHLRGTKEGCGIGECGACTIVMGGKAVNACLLPATQLDGREVLTVEGLNPEEGLHPLQQAFLDHHAVQCGFCTPGFLMSAHALLGKGPRPGREDVIRGISGNLCRCTGYQQILSAVLEAADRYEKEEK
jgi:aerobic carbon-monoxide dehydrogenase small subunit